MSIRNDADTLMVDFSNNNTGVTTPKDQFTNIGSSVFTLQRQSSGVFDSTDYNTNSYNRGFISFTYIPD